MQQRRTSDQPSPPRLQRRWQRASLAQQQALLALACAALPALALLAGQQALALPVLPAWALPLALLVGGGCAAAGVFWLAGRHALALRRLAEAARQLRRDEAGDELNLPLLPDADELRDASVSLRRLVEFNRQQRQALLARNTALGEQLQRRTHELSTLQDLSVGLAAGQDLTDLVDEALKALEQTLEYSSASLWARDRRKRNPQVVLLGYRIGDGDAAEAGAAAVGALRGRRLSRGNLQRYEQIERERAPLIENNVRQGLLSWLWEKVTDDASTSSLYRTTRAWMGLPLTFREEVLGVMRVDHRVPGYFDAERARLLSAVCSQTALAMHHAQLLLQQREIAVTAERNRIARELHDAVSQTLFAANMVAGSLVKLASRESREARDQALLLTQAQTLERLNRGALAEMRLLMFELRPDALEHASLAELLKPVIEALECRGDIVVRQDIASAESLAPAVRRQLYRIAQEALSNVGRHSGASEAEVRWQPDSAQGALLVVADNGQGFDPAQPRPGHFGVDNLHSRAAEIGATLRITSTPGQGTEVSVLLALS